jgi:hypothetical protein
MAGAPPFDTLRQSEIMIAIIGALHRAWPQPVDLSPGTLDPAFADVDRLFVEAIHNLVSEGLVSIEALLVGASPDPVARAAVLTRKGAIVLYHVTRPM